MKKICEHRPSFANAKTVEILASPNDIQSARWVGFFLGQRGTCCGMPDALTTLPLTQLGLVDDRPERIRKTAKVLRRSFLLTWPWRLV